ncbi:MAG: glycosyltransferase family 2 protein [Candidatus Acidiferrales bacterium]
MSQRTSSEDTQLPAIDRSRRGLVMLPLLPEMPLVSVLITSYNHGCWVGGAVQSVLQQTYTNFEIIVCEDGSTDNSMQVLSALAQSDSRITVIQQENRGQCGAFNTDFAASKGDIICLLDCDDIFAPGKIERVVRKFQSNPEFGTVANSVNLVDENGGVIQEIRADREGYLGPSMFILRKNQVATQCSGLSFRRPVLDAIFPLPEDLRVAADGAISGPALNIAATGAIPEVLSIWRIHSANSGGAMSQLPTLSPKKIEETLDHLDFVLNHTSKFVSRRLGSTYDVSGFRLAIEYRLSLGILRKDKGLVRQASEALRNAFPRRAPDYTRARYLFWRTLAHLPFAISEPLMQFAYWVNKKRLTRTTRRGAGRQQKASALTT